MTHCRLRAVPSARRPDRPGRRATLGLLAAAMLLGALQPAAAQGFPPQDPGSDRSAACIRLEGQLAQLGRGGGRDNSAALAKQRSDLDFLTGQARQMGCDKRGFLIFQPQLPPQCDALNRQITQARTALDRATMAARDQQGGVDEQRRQLVYALAQNDCGPQYRAALGNASANAQPRQPRNFFEQLFGVPRGGGEDETGPIDVEPMEMPKVSTYRTVCVRTCDGFFFPISFAATPARFSTDEVLCQRQCPGTEARLFAYRNPGEDIRQAVGTNGQPYTSLPNALLFQKQFVPTCSCRPAGMSWGEALAGVEGTDPTLRQGDIVVTEDKAREMAQPRAPGSPGASRAATSAAPKPAAARPAAAAPAQAPRAGQFLPPAPVQ
ncbi:DUF2865 domain-containing protein [Ancylobacter terrae]|uniref:DUF2865 domain-containing protein n=1 Tax=Ancylobacter sp. sgz301288 TaxID=3342077 RepID=UPI00385BC7DB